MFEDFAQKLVGLSQSPGWQQGLNQIAALRPMTKSQAAIDASQAQTRLQEREAGIKEQQAQRELLQGQFLQQFLSGDQEAGRSYLMVGGRPEMIGASQLLGQQAMQGQAMQDYQTQFGGVGMTSMPPAAPPPMPIPGQQIPPTAPQPTVQAPPMQSPGQMNTTPDLATAEANLRLANTRLAAAGSTQNPGVIAKEQALRDQAKVDYDRALSLSDKGAEAAKKAQEDAQRLSIPGMEMIGGSAPNDAAVNKAREQVTAREKYANIVKRLQDFYANGGSGTKTALGMGSTGTTEYKSAMAILSDLRNMERVVNETGVLNVGELPFLEQSYATFDPTNISNVNKTPKELSEAASAYLENRLQQIDANLASYGYKPKGAPSLAPKKAALPPVPPELAAQNITAEDILEYEKGKK